MKRLTIFTPTYNRSYCIKNLYKSLCEQSNQDFVWIIVDDGSTDDTEEVIRSFIQEAKIDIVYEYKENGGKHTALMKGIELSDTELFVCVDSDDSLVVNAVEIIINKHLHNINKKLLGYYFRQVTKNNKNVASPYPIGLSEVGICDLYNKYGFSGDTVIVLKTTLIKDYRFPVFEGEKFVTERVFYNKINHIAPMLLCEEQIYVSEYLGDGYSNNADKLVFRNPYGFAVDCLSEEYYNHHFAYRVKKYAQYIAAVVFFRLDKEKLSDFDRAPAHIKVLSVPLSFHYINRFKRIRKCLNV